MSNYYNRILYSSISYSELKEISGLTVSGIYKIENLINHKVYIGQSKDIIRRLKSGHLSLNRECNPYLKKAFIKYGFDNFSFEIIKETYDLNYWEIFLIQIYHSTDENYGYNILFGGEGGSSEVTKQSWEDDVIRKKRKIGTKSYWESEEGQRQRKINSERNKSLKQTKGYCWYNNGVIQTVAKECPEGFVKGQLRNKKVVSEETKQKLRDVWKNRTEEQKKELSEKLSKAHIGHHFTEEQKKHIGDGNRGRRYFNNGEIEVLRFECPEGFVPGRCPKAKAAISKGMNK